MRSLKSGRKIQGTKPEEIDMLSFSQHIFDIASVKSGRRGDIDVAKCLFTREEITEALSPQGIQGADMEDAISHCIKLHLIKKEGEKFIVKQWD